MRTIMMAVVWAAGAWSAEPARKEGTKPVPAEERRKVEVAVGETVPIELACNPTTGYAWEVKSLDRRVAVPAGPAKFREDPEARGMAGAGGSCVIGIKGVKPGKTRAVLVYRRPWEKGGPAKTAAAEITVLPKKIP
jgi:predicted secreted protein